MPGLVKQLLGSILLLYAVSVSAETVIVQIGGGNHIDNSQGQIEDNVIWLNRILRKTGNSVQNFFASGVSNEKDVALFSENESEGAMSVISRVFDEASVERIQYRHNAITDLSGSMYKDEIVDSLRGILSNLQENQDFLLIYNGHGGINESDVRENKLKLWGDEDLTVSEMDRLFDSAPKSATLRFIFPQCFSGGFYNLIFENPQSKIVSTQQRCGFFAESPYDESEGCSLSTNREEYRDYSTFFFAPLNGKTRNDEALQLDPDINGDGGISFGESHIYTIKTAVSKDLSRSTSEAYLEDWAPWYLRWGMGRFDEESLYWEVANFVAEREGLDLDDSRLGRLRHQMNKRLDDLESELEQCETEAEELALRIRKDTSKHWPELIHPYTTGYKKVIATESEEIADAIRANTDYPSLLNEQNTCVELQKEILNAERKKTQVDKILRYKKLALIQYYFNMLASDEEQAQYESLLDCESGVFFSADQLKRTAP